MRDRALLCIAVLTLAGCDLPRDPEGTLERVRGGELRVGVLTGNERAAAEDRRIVDALAGAIGARPSFRDGDAHQLMWDLQRGGLDLVIGGLPSKTPFSHDAGLSRSAGPLFRPDAAEDRVLAVRSGENGFLRSVNEAIEAAGAAAGQ